MADWYDNEWVFPEPVSDRLWEFLNDPDAIAELVGNSGRFVKVHSFELVDPFLIRFEGAYDSGKVLLSLLEQRFPEVIAASGGKTTFEAY